MSWKVFLIVFKCCLNQSICNCVCIGKFIVFVLKYLAMYLYPSLTSTISGIAFSPNKPRMTSSVSASTLFNVGRFSYHTFVNLWSPSEIIHSSTAVQWWWLVLLGVQGSSVLLYFYSIGPSNTIGHKLWFPNCGRLGRRNTWGFLNFEATEISNRKGENPALSHSKLILGLRLLLELENHWTWFNLRTHMFMYFLPWDIILPTL